MRAILIETDKHTLREVEFAGTLHDAYRLLGITIIERVPLPPYNDREWDLWVDEEGLLNGAADRIGLFQFKNFDQPLAGRGLIAGNIYDPEDGEKWAPLPDVYDIRTFAPMVSWLTPIKE